MTSSAAAVALATSEAAGGRLRIAFALDSFEIGGTELNAVRLAERLDRDRFDLRFACLTDRGPLLERVRAHGVPVERFPIPSLVGVGALRSGWHLAAWLRRERIQILHAHDIYSNIFAVPWGRLAGVPAVIASRRWWTETIRPEHSWLNRMGYRLAHRVLANSEAVGSLVVAEGVPREKVFVVPNFVEEAAFQPPPPGWVEEQRAALGLRAEDRVVGIIANFHAIKDHATLLRALAALGATHPRVKLVLVGDGSEGAPLRALAEALGVADRVVFAGRRPQSPTLHWLFDVSVLSSRGEGFPNSVVEAMAAGRPVVATRVGGIPDAVADEETGILVSPGDPAAMAGAIGRLLSEPALAGRMGERGALRARERFHGDAVLQVLERRYREMLGLERASVG